MALGGQWDFIPPAWVGLIQVARWLGVAPWELEHAPSYWVERASIVMEAEDHAQQMAQRNGG